MTVLADMESSVEISEHSTSTHGIAGVAYELRPDANAPQDFGRLIHLRTPPWWEQVPLRCFEYEVVPSLQIAVAPEYEGAEAGAIDADASAATAGTTMMAPARARPAAIFFTLLNIIPPWHDVRRMTSIERICKR